MTLLFIKTEGLGYSPAVQPCDQVSWSRLHFTIQRGQTWAPAIKGRADGHLSYTHIQALNAHSHQFSNPGPAELQQGPQLVPQGTLDPVQLWGFSSSLAPPSGRFIQP